MNAASALARESTALATSSAVEKRPNGMVARNLARRVSSTGPPAKSADRAGSGVDTGVMQFTRGVWGGGGLVEGAGGEIGGQAGVGVEHGVDAVHADVVGAEFGRHRFAGGDDGALGAVVPGQSGAGAQAGGGGDVDETAAAGFAHRRHGVDGAQVDAFHVDGVDLVELV